MQYLKFLLGVQLNENIEIWCQELLNMAALFNVYGRELGIFPVSN